MPDSLVALLHLIPFASPMGTLLFTLSAVCLVLAWRLKACKINGSGMEVKFGK